MTRDVTSWNTACKSTPRPPDRAPRNSMVSRRYMGRATCVRTLRLAVVRKFRPALRWTLHSSPSAVIIPCPVQRGRRREMALGVGGSDELTEQVPEHALDKAPLAEDALIPEDKVEIPGVVDHDTGRQAGHDNLERLVAELALAVDK